MVGRGARVPRVEWTADPAFGYEFTASVPGVDDIEILQLCGLYERTGRAADYAGMTGKMKQERSEYLASFDGLDPRSSSRSPTHRKRAAGRNGLRHVRANAIPFARCLRVAQDRWIPFLLAEQG